MYLPKLFEETDVGVMHALMRAHVLGTWVTVDEGGGDLIADHIPFFLDGSRGPFGTLMCHVARPNAVWKRFADVAGGPGGVAGASGGQLAQTGVRRSESLVIFQGPEAYITPSWYPSKAADGKVVPTWNYAVVHAYGVPHVMKDPAWLLAHLKQLTGSRESNEREPWHVTDAPADYIDQMMRGIVGIEIPLTRLVGKWKVSQNRTDADKRGVVAGLATRAHPGACAMADLVAKHVSDESPSS